MMMRSALFAGFIASLAAPVGAQSIDQARSLFESQKYAEARAIVEPLAKRDPQAALLMGQILLQTGNASQSAEYLETAVKLNPQSSDAYNWLGKAYGTQAENANPFKQAMLARKTRSAWERAIALDPGNLDARRSPSVRRKP